MLNDNARLTNDLEIQAAKNELLQARQHELYARQHELLRQIDTISSKCPLITRLSDA